MKLPEITPTVFELVAHLLRRLLLNHALAKTINDEGERRKLFGDFMFPVG